MHLPFIHVNISFLPQRWVFMFKGFQSPILRQPFFQCELFHWLLALTSSLLVVCQAEHVPQTHLWPYHWPVSSTESTISYCWLHLYPVLGATVERKAEKEHLRPGKEPSRPKLRLLPLSTGSKKPLQSLGLEFLVFPFLKVSSALNTA